MIAPEQKDSPVTTTSEARTGWIQSTVERLARTLLGQIVLGQLDRFLWVVEKSAEWSLPLDESSFGDDESGKSSVKPELVRPLPWILFLPGLVILRSLRASLNIGAFIFGLSSIEPITVIKFIQKNRKRLKTLRSNTNESPSRTKFRRKNQDKRLSINEAKKALIRSIRLTLSTLACLDGSKPSLSPPPTKIHISALELDATVTSEEKSATESTGSPQHTVKETPRDVASSVNSDDSADETLQEKINRLALESSTDDPDFIPATGSTLSSSDNDDDDDSDNEDDLNVSQNEIQDITADTADTKLQLNTKTVEQAQKPEQSTPIDNCDKAECDKSSSPRTNSKETPTTLNQDGDAPFYSPISSNSSSSHTPERAASPTAKQNSHQTDLKTNELGNGEAYLLSGSTMSGRSFEETNNGVVVEKRSTNVSKYHHRGKRTSHGNRKKK